MKDRAMQALYLMALEPIAETTGDRFSYGFRKKRRTMDAIRQIDTVLNRQHSPEWIWRETLKAASTISATTGFLIISLWIRRYSENG